MSDSKPARPQAVLIITANKITDISDGFIALTGYSRSELLGRDSAEIFDLFRVPCQAWEELASDGSAACYLFTKALEPREVTISALPEQADKALRYTFEECPNSRLEDKTVFINHIFSDNKIGAAIYSVPDLILLKANARYLEDTAAYFGESTHPVGHSLRALMPDYKGSDVEAVWNKVLDTAQGNQIIEYKTENTQGHMTYFDVIHTPILENGRMKYVYLTQEDVTPRVLAKQQNSEHEKELQLEKEKLESIIFNMSDPMVIFNQEGAIDILNKAARKILKNNKIQAQKIGDVRESIEFYDAEDRLILPQEVPPFRVLSGEILVDFRVKIKQRERCFYADINGSPIYDKDGTVIFAVLCLRNITEKVLSDDVIQYQADLMQNIWDIIISTDENFIIKSWNRAAEATYGWTEEEAIGQNVHALFKTRSIYSDLETDNTTLLEQGKNGVEHIHTCKNGTKINVYSKAQTIKNPSGQMTGTVGIIRDITEWKKTDAAIARQNLIVRTINEVYEKAFQYDNLQELGQVYLKLIETVTASKVGFIDEYGADCFFHDATGDPEMKNQRMLGKEGPHWMPDGFKPHGLYRSALETGKDFIMNNPTLDPADINVPDGHPGLTAFLCVPYIRDEKALGMIGVGNREGGYGQEEQELLEAITPTIIEVLLRKRMELQFMEKQQEILKKNAVLDRQSKLLDQSSEAILAWELGGAILYWNDGAEKMYGYNREQALGRQSHELLKTKYLSGKENIDAILAEDKVWRGEIEHSTKSGTRIMVESIHQVIEDELGRQIVLETNRDITSRIAMETALRESEVRLRAVLENSNDIIYSQNMRTNRYEYVSPASKTVLGYTPEEFMAIDEQMTQAMIHPDDLPAFLGSFTELNVKGVQELKYRQRTKSGDYRWYSNRLSVVKNQAGRVLYRFGNIHDITEQVENDAVIRYQANLLHNISDMIISTDNNRIIKSWNKSAERAYGWTEAEAMGQDVRKLLQSQLGREAYKKYVHQLLEKGRVEVEDIHTSKDGRKLNAVSAVELLKNSRGEVTGAVAIIHDITEQKKMLAALRESEVRLRSVLENSGDIIYSQNVQTNRYEYVSPASKTILGYTPEEFMAIDEATTQAMIHPDDLTAFWGSFAALEVKGEQELKYRQRTKNGDYRWFSNRLSIVKDEAGRARYRFGNIHDITEQVENDALIRYQANLLHNISDMIISTDENLNIKSWNKAAERAYGWTEAEAIGKNIRSLLEEEAVDTTFEKRYELLREQGRVQFEIIQTTKEGKKIYALNTLELIKNSDGKFIGTVGIFRNNTERKKIEDALRESEMHLRLAAEGAGLGTFSIDSVTGKIILSDALKAIWGLKPNDAICVDDNIIYVGLHPEDKQKFVNQVIAAKDPNGNGMFDFDYRIIQPDGAMKWLHVKGQTTFAGEGDKRHPLLTAGVVIDITKRVEAENSVREISEELRNIAESTNDYIFSIDKNYRLIFCNSAFSDYIEQNLGQKLKKGMLLPDVLTMLDISVIEDIFLRVAGEGKIQIDMNVENGRVLALTFNPVFVDAQLVEITVFGKDITARVHGEREIIRLNASLEKRVLERTNELQKSISALQNLSRLISHDMKEPIREIETYANQLCKEEAAEPYALEIKKTCGMMTQMIQELAKYAMSSDHHVHKETVNVKKMITTIYSELKSSIPNSCVLQFESGLPLVAADQILIQQVLYNLLSNAMKFSSKREIAEITFGCYEEHNDYVFYVKDNGVGFDMQYAHKLFNIFERLHSKEEFEGTGIGLAAVRNIIQRHGGRTWIESNEGVGTVVYFTLPIAAEA